MAYLAILDNNWPIEDLTSGPDRGYHLRVSARGGRPA